MFIDIIQKKKANDLISWSDFRPRESMKEISRAPTPSASPAPQSSPRVWGNGTHGSGSLVLKKRSTQPRPWTDVEHAQLIELLETFPEEKIQKRRYEKIAQVLGRTEAQVSSRVQKYFNRLAEKKKGLPGRSKRKSSDSRFEGLNYRRFSVTELLSDGEGETPVKIEAMHIGFKCDKCAVEPIRGSRFQCMNCPELDLCSDCFHANFETKTHLASHKFEEIQQPKHYYQDNDYTDLSTNYLDPNYNP